MKQHENGALRRPAGPALPVLERYTFLNKKFMRKKCIFDLQKL